MRGETLAARLAEPPDWLEDFVAYLAAHHCPARSCVLITTLSRLLEDEHPNHPQSVLERARRPGRSMGSLARALETFFTQRGLAMATDQDQRLASGRRKKRIDGAPAGMRAAVAAFAESMLRARDRARRAGTRPRADRTIESALAIVRDLACFLDTQRGKRDWALVDVADIEAFLAELPNNRARRLTVLGQFFRFARNRRVVLVDPTRGMSAKRYRGFRGRTLAITQQRALFRRWSADPRRIRTRPSSGSSPYCTVSPAVSCACWRSTISTRVIARSTSASAPTGCRWTRSAGPLCNAASITATPCAPTTRM